MKQAAYAVVTLLAVTLITPAFAAPEDDAHKPHAGHKPPHEIPLLPPRAVERLNLTNDQKAKIDEINKKYDEERDAWLAKNKPDENLRAQIRDAKKAGDEAKLKTLKAESRAKMKPLWELRQSYMKQVRVQLTPEQVTALDEMRAEVREHRKERKKKHEHDDEQDDEQEHE